MKSDRLAVLKVSDVFLVGILAGLKAGFARKFIVSKNPIPKDAEIVKIENVGREIQVTLRSARFAEVSGDDSIPEICPELIAIYDNA